MSMLMAMVVLATTHSHNRHLFGTILPFANELETLTEVELGTSQLSHD
jgi:hypothetical protein